MLLETGGNGLKWQIIHEPVSWYSYLLCQLPVLQDSHGLKSSGQESQVWPFEVNEKSLLMDSVDEALRAAGDPESER